MNRYLLVHVYSWIDSSNNGISSPKRDLKLFVEAPRGNWSESEIEGMGGRILELNSINGSEFFKERGENRHVMNGGNFAFSSDSRFVEKYGDRPIRIHDRAE